MEVEEQAELMVEVKRGNNLQVQLQTNKCVKIRVINWDLNDCKLII